jgi:fatty acid desaturase
MTTEQVLASDAERAEAATIVQTAGGEGRLTLTETEERLTSVYAARYRQELAQITRDLPRPAPPAARRPAVCPVRLHAAVVVLVSALLIARWVLSGVPFFWPAFPIGWLVASLVIHAAARGRLDPRRRVVPR